MIDGLLVGGEVLLQPEFGPGNGGNEINVEVGTGQSVLGGAVSAFFTTLIVGVLLVTFAEEYTVRMMDGMFEDPVSPFLRGIFYLLGLVLIIILLAITIIGILLAIPLIILAYLVWAVGVTLVLLAVADRFVDHEEGWLKPVLVASLLNGAFALSGIGWLVGFVLGALGFGRVVAEYRSR